VGGGRLCVLPEITHLLVASPHGDRQAAANLLPRVHDPKQSKRALRVDAAPLSPASTAKLLSGGP
jgi:hypothetical protein